jgi:hypothetical protein
MAKPINEDDVDYVLEVTDAQRVLIKNNPLLFNDVWIEMQQAIMLNDWPTIIGAISIKAARGDISAAKFLTDFIEPLAKTDLTPQDETVIEWEVKAIQLRDYLSLEMSALMLVESILDKLLSKPAEFTHELLFANDDGITNI